MRWLALLLMAGSFYTVFLWQGMDISSASYDPFGRLEWRGGRVDRRAGAAHGAGQLAFYHSGDRFALHVHYGRYGEHEQRVTARLAPSLSVARRNSQAFKVLATQGKEIGTGECVFVEEFDWGVGQDYWYPDGGDNCALSFTDTVHGKVEITLGFAGDEGLQFAEGRVTKDTHDFAWWPNPEMNPLAFVSTASYQGKGNALQLTYTFNERYGLFASDSGFTLLLNAAGKQYHIAALADKKLPGAIWGRDNSFRLFHPITESGQIGHGSCQRPSESYTVTCDFEFHHLGRKVTLTKTYHLDKLTSIAGTVVAGDKTIRWEAIDMREFTTPSPL